MSNMKQVLENVVDMAAKHRLDIENDQIMFALADAYTQGMLDAYSRMKSDMMERNHR